MSLMISVRVLTLYKQDSFSSVGRYRKQRHFHVKILDGLISLFYSHYLTINIMWVLTKSPKSLVIYYKWNYMHCYTWYMKFFGHGRDWSTYTKLLKTLTYQVRILECKCLTFHHSEFTENIRGSNSHSREKG